MILRPATSTDAPALAELGRSSFCASFAHIYHSRDLHAFLDQVYTREAVEQEIADPRIVHRLAEEDGALLAFCKLQYPSGYAEHSDAADPIALNQLYCAPGRTGEGIGAKLLGWTIEEARARGCDAVQLSVYSENFGAQAFYRRYGFAKIADIDFWVGEHRDDEFLYELRLDPQPRAG